MSKCPTCENDLLPNGDCPMVIASRREYQSSSGTGEFVTIPNTLRQFDTGATRDSEDGKLPYGFDSPLVDRRYAEYMNSHRLQSDGEMRDPDNWTNGMSRDVYMNSLHRHYQDLRLLWAIYYGKNGVSTRQHREKLSDPDVDLETALCAILFNVKGMLFEVLNGR